MEIPSPRSHGRARIEITPLIDIIFFLLATFMMVSLSMVKSKGLPVVLPSASTSQDEERGDDFSTITVDASNAVYPNRDPVDPQQLDLRLQALREARPDPKVFINGDENASLGTVIHVLDALRRSGIHKISFETQPVKKP